MLSLLFSAFVFLGVVALIRFRLPAAIAAVFILFSLITRTASLVYIDLAEPVYSEQLGVMVGGGSSMPLFAASILVFIGVLAYFFRPAALLRINPQPLLFRTRRVLTGKFLLITTGFMIAVLYIDMLQRGVVPLLSGMDRLEYNKLAGPLHGKLHDFGFLLATVLGAGFVLPRLAGRDYSFTFFVLYLIVLSYFALTGNRFSAFYSFTSFFVLPFASVFVLIMTGHIAALPLRRPWRRLICSPRFFYLVLTIGVIGITLLVLQSVINVRSYDDPMNQLFQRILVQPVELWWITWSDINSRPTGAFDYAWTAIIGDPIDPTRNTSIQMLMLKNLGYDRTSELLDMGQQYAGGYPEILFELFGPWFALPAAIAFSIPTVLLLRMAVAALCEHRLFTVFLAVYVCYGFNLLFISGMINFLLPWTFWVKIGALGVVYVIERSLSRQPSAFSLQAGRLVFIGHIPK